MTPLSIPPPDPESLFARARAGDEAAWAELFRTCYPKVIRVVRRKLNDRSMRKLYDSTDFASEVMKSLAAKADRLDFPSVGALIAFLEEVAERKVIDEYRKVHSQKRDISRQRPLDGDGGCGTGYASRDHTASKFAVASESHERLLEGQAETERLMIELKREGYSHAEIAAKTGWNIRKVQRFFKGLLESFEQSNGDA